MNLFRCAKLTASHRATYARNARRSRAAVGLQHVAVDEDGVLTEGVEVDDRPKGSPDEPLDFLRAAVNFQTVPPRRCAVAPGSISYSAVTQPLPCPFFHAGTPTSQQAVQRTLVRPASMSTDPAGFAVYRRRMHRSQVTPLRPSARFTVRSQYFVSLGLRFKKGPHACS